MDRRLIRNCWIL
jgi:hypothetical protein